MARLLDDPEELRARATELLMIAGTLRDEVAHQILLEIAARYERLAQRADDRLGEKTK
jgi:hypothetical protein